jgi:ATP-dependent DNA helicase PIF1
MINEKLMINLKILSLIDDWLRVIFPATSHLPFGGMNILISGNFYQLPPVGGKPFYSLKASHVDEIKGQQLYWVFDKTIWLTQVMQQLKDNPISV